MHKKIMIQGTGSSVGKSIITAGLCRVFAQDGYRVSPFKSQNMALNSFVDIEGLEMGRAQVVQAEASKEIPRAFMNPILLKPNSDNNSQVIIEGKPLSNTGAKDYFANSKLWKEIALRNYKKIEENFDIGVLEGGGSPAEINLREYDCVNMGMAELVDAPVILVGNIEVGGVFASLYGTIALLDKKDRDRIKGLIINKFRGDIEILKPGIDMLMERLKTEGLDIKFLGVVPYEKLEIEEGELAQEVPVFEGFITYGAEELEKFRKELGLAMTFADIAFVQEYFRDTEKRDPTETEIKVLDTYWSDHCRHTTFETRIKNIVFPKSAFGETLQKAFENYLGARNFVHQERLEKKYISLMDMATICGKEMRKTGKLDDLEVSDEINACSVYIDVDVDGKIEKWLLMFKNETHNHPTEIEPFGGASTCLGGAIRDPLSGRSYVYQAIRVTGSGNPLEKLEDTLQGKLPQKKITTGAAAGYSSYGNQIGLTTGHVAEIYHDGYKAKRMEVGAVVGAVPADWVRRENASKGDIVVLLGGKTGRDGCGGATGSSKEHTDDSLRLCGAEVQKGNAPEERKIQRLFRNPEVTRLVKKCNDFGAGGVSVAIGELAPGLDINLDVVPTKYLGLSGTELAISESQERMAVVIEAKDRDKFIELANRENLLATVVAVVTDTNRLVLNWKGKKIVDISREFLDTNGVTQETEVEVENISYEESPLTKVAYEGENLEAKWYNMLSSLNVASQKGLMEIFDSTIGATTVLMPFGGKYQMTPTDVSVQKLPLLKGETDTASAITWGYNPVLSSWSQFHGGAYAVVESLAKLVSVGVDYKRVRLSFQEYFQKLGQNPKNWGKPFSALLGTIEMQRAFEIPAIGGKDSMSGTFNDIHVPPTLISFAVSPVKASVVISPEFKKAGNKIYLVKHHMLENYMPLSLIHI